MHGGFQGEYVQVYCAGMSNKMHYVYRNKQKKKYKHLHKMHKNQPDLHSIYAGMFT